MLIIIGNVDGNILGLDVGTESGSLYGCFDGSNCGNLVGLLIGSSLWSTYGNVLGSNECIKLRLSGSKVLVGIYGNVGTLNIDVGTYLGYLDRSFDGSNDGKLSETIVWIFTWLYWW